MRVAEAWKLGTKGKDDGVLVVVAVKDRKVRIEVGGGLEGGLTDAQSGRIIRTAIVPAFREGRYGEGLHAAGQQILAALGALPEGMAKPPRRQVQDDVPAGILGMLFGFLFSLGAPALVLLVIAFVVLRALFGSRRGPRGPWGGGGFGAASPAGAGSRAAEAAAGAAAGAGSAAAVPRGAGRSARWPRAATFRSPCRTASRRPCGTPSPGAPGRSSRWSWTAPSPTTRRAGSPPWSPRPSSRGSSSSCAGNPPSRSSSPCSCWAVRWDGWPGACPSWSASSPGGATRSGPCTPARSRPSSSTGCTRPATAPACWSSRRSASTGP